MPDIITRPEWSPTEHSSSEISQPQTEIYIHYPGAAGDIGNIDQEATALRLNSIYASHTGGLNPEYNDIAYNWAVDQGGRIFELRGTRQSGANGGSVSNRRGQSILCVVGNTEPIYPALIRSVRDLVDYIREWQPTAERILGHQESVDLDPGDTECPGLRLMDLIKEGAFESSVPIPPGEGPGDPGPPDPGPIETVLTVDGRFGQATVRVLQRRLGVTVDGRAGNNTWRALQAFLGTPVDGVVSNQSYRAEELGNGISQGWEFTGRGSSGSTMVRALQGYLGLSADGIWFEGTTRALQTRLNNDDGAFSGSAA